MSNKYNYEVHRKPVTRYDEYGDFVVHRNNEYYKSPSYYQSLNMDKVPQVYDSKANKNNEFDYKGDLGRMQYDLNRLKKSNPAAKPNSVFFQNANYLLQDKVEQNFNNNNQVYQSSNQYQRENAGYLSSQSAVFQQQNNTDRNNYQTQQMYSSKEQFHRQKAYSRNSPVHQRGYNQSLIPDKVGNQGYDLYNSAIYQKNSYQNKNLRSVAPNVIQDPYLNNSMDFGNRAYIKDKDTGQLPILGKSPQKQKIEEYQNVFQQINYRNKQIKNMNLEQLEKQTRNYALANFNDIQNMRNISHKLEKMKDKIKKLNMDPVQASKYRKAVERRIESQISNMEDSPERQQFKLEEIENIQMDNQKQNFNDPNSKLHRKLDSNQQVYQRLIQQRQKRIKDLEELKQDKDQMEILTRDIKESVHFINRVHSLQQGQENVRQNNHQQNQQKQNLLRQPQDLNNVQGAYPYKQVQAQQQQQ